VRRGGWLQAIGAGAIIGGALGNVWDRLRWGAVADFINMSCCGIANPFAFNLADAAIFGGAALLVLAGNRATGRDGRDRVR
jgi:signal peptidase II